MYGRPKLGNHKMVTVATRVEPDELAMVKQLADECGMSVCGYLRDMIRAELSRASRSGNGSQSDRLAEASLATI